MKTIAYYISDYGYGHAARSIAVIRKLLVQSSDLQVIICNHFALNFLKASFSNENERITFRDVQNDIGYVLKESSIELDVDAFQEKYSEYSNRGKRLC